MSNTATIWYGTAAQGVEVTEWERDYDDDGFRFEYEYVVIPREAVEVKGEMSLSSNDHVSFDGFLRMIEAQVRDLVVTYGPDTVIEVSAGSSTGLDLVASGWSRPEALIDSFDPWFR